MAIPVVILFIKDIPSKPREPPILPEVIQPRVTLVALENERTLRFVAFEAEDHTWVLIPGYPMQHSPGCKCHGFMQQFDIPRGIQLMFPKDEQPVEKPVPEPRGFEDVPELK